jgi:hypothetical protein
MALAFRKHLLGATIAMLAAAPACAADSASIALTIRNAGDAPLRCVLVLAHFVTKDLPAIPRGGAITLAMERDADLGTLSQRRRDGRVMMIENLLCGASARWDETRGEVPLLALRGVTPARMATACRIATRLACERPEPAGAM